MANLPDMPILAALAVGYLVLVCLMLSSPKMLKWVVMLLLFPASTAIAVDDFTKQIANPTWLMPLQTNRSLAYLILGTTLAGGVLLHLGRLDRPKLGVQTLFILAIGVYAAAIRVLHYGVQDGAESVLLALITIPAIALAITGSIRTWSDFHNVLRILPVFTLLYLGALALQYAISPRTLVMGAENRFVGFLGNPQHAAALFGPLVGLVIFSILNEPIKVLRFAWMGALVGCVICLLWTQSRTGALMAVMSTAGVFYQRIGAAILGLPLVALLGLAALQVAEAVGIELRTSRFVSTQNTRAEVWSNMWEAAKESPVIGRPFDEIAGSENSVLIGFAHYGAGMLVILLGFMLISGILTIQLLRVRREMPRRYRPIVDAILGYNAAYFTGAMFEGYMISRVAASVVLIQIFAALAAKLFVLARAEKESGAFDRLLAAEADPYQEGDDWSTHEELVFTSTYGRSDRGA